MTKFLSSRRRSLLVGAAAAAGATMIGGTPERAHARAPAEGPWAIELFTSQGCSSCPPADAYLGNLAKRPDIVALSFHVDYWDYIGWKDPFATRATTERQRAYARVLKQRYVYTPEMVVDGIGHDTGRERGPIEALLGDAQATLAPARDARAVAHRRRPAHDQARGLSARRPAGRRHAGDLRPTPLDAGGERREPGPHARQLQHRAPPRGAGPLGRLGGDWTSDADRIQPGQGVAVIVQHADHGPVIGCNKLEPMVSG